MPTDCYAYNIFLKIHQISITFENTKVYFKCLMD